MRNAAKKSDTTIDNPAATGEKLAGYSLMETLMNNLETLIMPGVHIGAGKRDKLYKQFRLFEV